MHATLPLNGFTNGNGNGHAVTSNGHHQSSTHGDSTAGRHRLATRLIHEGSEASAETGAVIPGISLSTTFKQDGVSKHKGFEYTRSLNPNRLAFETLIASLELPEKILQPQLHSTEERTRTENLPSALAFSSGSAVTQAIVSSLVKTNGHIISVNDVYGGTYRYLTKVASQSGIQTTFLELTASGGGDGDDLDGYKKVITQRLEDAFRPETQLVWLETPTNPTLRLVDIQLVSDVAHRLNPNVVVVVDNTFLSPYYQRPLELGADIVTHSVTKYLNGHSDVIMGVLVTPHKDLLSKLRFYQNAGGAVPSSFDCWLAQRGCKTLHLRLYQHGLNALAIARWLIRQDWVKEVMYPGLEGEDRKATRALAWRQLSSDAREKIEREGMTEESGFICGGMVSFRLDTGLATSGDSAAQISSDFLSSMKIFTLAESLGGIESLAELPSLMTHASVSDEDRAKLGIDDELIRLSVGVEDVRDLEHDLHQAALVALGLQK